MVRSKFVNISSLLSILHNNPGRISGRESVRRTKLDYEYTAHEPSNGRTASSSGT